MVHSLSPSLGGIGVLILSALACGATPATLTVDVDKPGIAVSPMFNGLMTEEINHAFDGGLYAELIQNRSFLDSADAPLHWSLVGDGRATLSLDKADPLNLAHPVSLRVDLKGAGAPVGVGNDGYWGIPVKPDTRYAVSFYAKASDGFSGPLTVSLQSDNGDSTYAKGSTSPVTSGWKKYTLSLQTGSGFKPSATNKFVISAPTSATGSLSLSLVSLFPPTYMGRPDGLRPDLMQLMAGLHPSFLRMPGGNYLEGNTFPTRFDWKKMIGPVDQRPGHDGCWGYRSSDGFGLPEFLTWCEQLKMEPVLAVFAGYTLNGDYVPAGPKLQPYVDEALQEIEYVSGDSNTEWGRRRAEDGHPSPFTLHYVEIGNEDMYDKSGSYNGRFAQFYDAIKSKHPQLHVIATEPVKSRRPDVVDDHYYRSASRMAFDGQHYDRISRNGPKVFVGEWATQEGRPTPDLNAGLADAAWLLGLERDSDAVVMQAYAPLFVNVNNGASQWPTNLIGYDALTSYGSPSYWAQAMLSSSTGDVVLPTDVQAHPQVAATEPVPHGAIGVGTWKTQSEYKDIQVTAPDGKVLLTADLSKDTRGWTINGGKWNVQDAAIKQSADSAGTWATIGDPNWTDYTLTLKARKIGGDEGFLVLFRVQNPDHYLWWNLGGWQNSKTQLETRFAGEGESFGDPADITVEAGRWYDIKIVVKGHDIQTFLDGKPVTHATEEPAVMKTPLFAASTYDKAAGEVILKVVNIAPDTIDAAVDLRGAKSVDSAAKATVLVGDSPTATNTIDRPTNVVPHEVAVTDAAEHFHHAFPPYSLTVLRIKAIKG